MIENISDKRVFLVQFPLESRQILKRTSMYRYHYYVYDILSLPTVCSCSLMPGK